MDETLKLVEQNNLRFSTSSNLACFSKNLAELHNSERAFKFALSIEDNSDRLQALINTIETLIDKKERQKATEILEQTLATQQRIGSGWLGTLAEIYARIGLKEKASDLFVQALEAVEPIEEPFIKAWALTTVASKYKESGLKGDVRVRTHLHQIIHQYVDSL